MINFLKNKVSLHLSLKVLSHRIENLYNKPVKIIEVQTGSILKESDIVRYEDVYGRIN